MTLPTDNTSIPLAIIGMACRLPGAANLDEYWSLIAEGRSSIVEMPPDRLEREIYFNPEKGTRGHTYSSKASLLADRTFHRDRCPLPDEIVNSVDSTHLLMTEVAADALRHAGLDPFQLPLRNTSVFIGHAQGSRRVGDLVYKNYLEEAIGMLEATAEFQKLPAAEQATLRDELVATLRARIPTGADRMRFLTCNMVAGTIAKAFGLTGSWLALNSACASSLHAMLMGARALQTGRADMVIVGGASDCKSESLVLFSNAQTLSPTGSRPFDSDADGLVMAEGFVCLVMKTLDRAIADGDKIQAVVRGLGVATDGRGKSLWAPRKEGQMKAMRRAYRSGVDMAGLQYIECHATATQLGDATELETIGEVLKPVFPAGKRIPITSVKANIGHSLESAGMAGMIKAILCMQHQTYPAAINIRELNPKVDWASAPFHVPQKSAVWEAPADGSPRRAAVNAFGIGGLNMHVVIDEATPQNTTRQPAQPLKLGTPEDRSIAIIGMACILPGAAEIGQLWQTISSGADPKCAPPADRWPDRVIQKIGFAGQEIRAGFIPDYKYDWRKHKVPPKQVAEADPLQFMLLDGSEQALKDTGYEVAAIDRELCGVVIGSEFGGEFSDQVEIGLRIVEIQFFLRKQMLARGYSIEQIEAINNEFADSLLKRWPALLDEAGSFTTSTLASRISKSFDLNGGAVAIDSGSTSAMNAMMLSIDSLLSGDTNLMICAAGQRRMGPTAFDSLRQVKLLADNQPARSVLDASYNGVVPGEGVGAIVLKRLADARRDNDKIRAVIRGVGIATHDTASEAVRLAMHRACEMAGVTPADINFLELDTDESAAEATDLLAALSAEHAQPERQNPAAMGSATAQFGHLGGAASMVALLKAGLEIEQGQVAPTFGLQTAAGSFGSSQGVQAASQRMALTDSRLGAVVSWSKGQAFYVIMDDGKPIAPKPKRPAAALNQQPVVNVAKSIVQSAATSASLASICHFGAKSLSDLQVRLATVLADPSAHWASSIAQPFASTDIVRLAVVAEDSSALARKLKLASTQLNNAAAQQVLEQQGVFYRELLATRPRVVFVFPGQGSQYDGMLRDLVSQSPAAARAMLECNAAMQKFGYPTLAELAWNSPTQLGTNVWHTQAAMLLADIICLAAVRERGIEPDLVLGHSYGEFPALYAAGMWNLETVIQMTWARCAGISAVASSQAGLLATNAPPDEIKRLIAASGAQAYLANFNAPDQTVVGGKRAQLETVQAALAGAGHTVRMLDVPAAFHTPLMAGASRLLQQALETAEISAPKLQVISTVDNRLVTNADDVRRNLGVQLTTSVRYAPLIEELAAERPTVFVEIGPQQTLTKLNRRILPQGAAAIASDNPKRAGLEPLLCVQAFLECLGVDKPVSKLASAAAPGATKPVVSVRSVTPASVQPATPAKNRPLAHSPSLSKGVPNDSAMDDDIPHFDATERRRSKMRSASDQQAPPGANGLSRASAPPPPAPSAPPQRVAPVAAAPVPPKPVALPAPTPAPVMAAPVQPKPVAAPIPVVAEKKTTSTNPADLEKFLVSFVVEQTGYPPEVVELDADLEADLGIDSIKKAQLFGELSEYFDIGGVSATELSLDDFPTLRHVLNFLAAGEQASPAVTQAAPVQPAAPVQAAAPVAPPAPAPTPTPVAATASVNAGPATAELESFLVNFVVEQTGYPPEVVELDADLEADLGIDSIKKAQLFGELSEYFDIGGVSATELSLDDFPTLRHVLNFLAANQPASTVPSSPVSASPAVASAPVIASAPAPVSAPVSQPVAAPVTPASSKVAVGELESFLVNFVVEQTGYPPEVVELDADLEADLGIDSIKKAQLFGELSEYFDIGGVSATELSLDDFPTLRHVLNFLAANSAASAGSPTGNESASFSQAAPAPALEQIDRKIAPAAANGQPSLAPAADREYVSATNGVVHSGVVHANGNGKAHKQESGGKDASLNGSARSGEQPVIVAGTPYEMGWQHGSQFQAAIRKVLRTYTEFVGQSLDELPGAAECRQAHSLLSADVLDELQGIADAVGVPLANILAHHFAISSYASEEVEFKASVAKSSDSGLTHAVRHKAPLFGALEEVRTPVVLLRKPTRGIPSVAVTIVGTTTVLAGVNAAGIAVSADRGPLANSVTRTVLEQGSDLDTALKIASRQTSADWSACISDTRADRIASIRCESSTMNIRSDEPQMFSTGWSPPRGKLPGDATGELLTTSVRATALLNPPSLAEETALAEGDLLVMMELSVGKISIRNSSAPEGEQEKQFQYRHLLPEWTEEARQNYARLASPPAGKAQGTLSAPVVTSRFVLDMQSAPLPSTAAAEFTFTGAAIIVGIGETADALAKMLVARQVPVYRLSPQSELDTTLAQLEQICSTGPAPHLFFTGARDLAPATVQNEAAFATQRVSVMESPLFLCQKWLALATAGTWLDRCTLVATTAMQGDFGFAAGSNAPQGGALAGLLKGIFIEYAFLQGITELRVKVIDAPDEAPAEEVAANALRELASRDPDYEVAWNGADRQVPRASHQPLTDANLSSIRHGATWVVTGGARGITAACALELGKRYGLKLHLIGTTPLPVLDPAWRNLSAEGTQKLKSETILAARKAGQPAPAAWERVQKQIEIDRSFRAFEAAGVTATYHACDVGNRDSVAQVLDAIRQQDGPIEGILHGAGIDKSCRFEKKQRDVVSQTIRTKVDGAAHLMALTRRDPIRHFIGFGSISGRFGNFGQADYCLASEMLCKLVGAYRRERPWIQAVGMHWHGWDEVGMAAKPEMKSILEGKSDVGLMPLAEGIGHLVRELEAGLPEHEVVFTQKLHWERFASGMDVLLKHRGVLTGESSSGSAYAKPAAPAAAAPTPAAPPAPPVAKAASSAPASRVMSKTLAEAEPVELRTARFQMKTFVAPLPAGSPKEPVFKHAVWILGENQVAMALKKRLQASGVRVRQFSAAGDLDQLQTELTNAWNADPAGHLFLLTGRDEVAADLLSAAEIERRRHAGIIVPYFVAQNFLKLLHTKPELGQGTIAAAVSLGGDFGFSGHAVLPEGGAVAGFLKAVYIENSKNEDCRVRCKVIDAPQNDPPAQVAECLLREIAANEPEVEVAWAELAWIGGERRVVRPVAAPLSGVTSSSIPRGGVWIITGGARGITAITAREMSRRYGWKVHLLGTSPAPQANALWRNFNDEQLKQYKSQLTKETLAAGKSPTEAWERVQKDREIYKNLQELAAAGAQAEYHQCDVTDGPAVAKLLDKIRHADGPITGLIHGAGLIAPCKFETNRRALVEKLIRTKIDGLLNLLSALRNDPLTHCIGFGSISGRFGANGLSDYAAGNDGMVKILDWYRGQRPECKSFSFHWEQWEGAGVAMIPRLAWGPRSIMNMKYMHPTEGVRRIEEELGAGVPHAEVLPTFGEFYPMFYPLEQDALETAQGPSQTVARPMVRDGRQTEQGWQGDVALNPLVDPFLVEHRLRNKPILPVVIGLECLAEAATLASGKQVVGFDNVEMIDGLYFHNDQPVVAQVTVPSVSDNEAEASLTCHFRNRTGGLIQKDRLYLRAKAALADTPNSLSVSLPPVPTAWQPVAYPEASLMYNGAPFRCFEALNAVPSEGWAKLTALPLSGLVGSNRTRGWLLPSCVFDAAMFACGCHLWVHSNHAVSLPKHIDHLELGRLPHDGEACYVYFRNREMSETTACYDFTIVGADMGVILQVTGYHKFILTHESER